MANPIWPPELPQAPSATGFRWRERNVVLPFETELGPPLLRPVVTDVIYDIDLVFNLFSKAQVQILDDFYRVDLHQGTQQFDWKHPFTGDSQAYKFLTAPAYTTYEAGNLWNVGFRLETYLENEFNDCNV